MKLHALLALFVLLVRSTHGVSFRTSTNFGIYLNKILPRNYYLQGLLGKQVMQRVEPLMQKIVSKGGCNANVCFTLDGSHYVSAEDYRMQKEFVELAAALIGVDKSVHFAATQLTRPPFGLISALVNPLYGSISPLTLDQDAFLERVAGSSRFGGQPRLRRGIRFCTRQMRGRREDVNKIVMIADGRNRRLYRDRATRPLFRFMSPRQRGSVCAVAVGQVDLNYLAYLTGSAERVLPVDGYIELAGIVEKLVSQVCGLK